MRRIRKPRDCILPWIERAGAIANVYRTGGVSIVGSSGRIDINNTLEERLRLLETDALPMIRTTLFGKNENRKFYD